MADAKALIHKLRALRAAVYTEVPRKTADYMLRQTKENFRKQGYGNDYAFRKWPDRKHEDDLNYPMLRYKGHLFRSIMPGVRVLSRTTVIARVYTRNKVARIHNEGGNTIPSYYGDKGIRRPPYSNKTVSIRGFKVPKRQFMGIGQRTVNRVKQIIKEEIRKVMRK